MCELTVCEDGYDQTFDAAWELVPPRCARCSGMLENTRVSLSVARAHEGQHRQAFTEHGDHEWEIMAVSGEMHEMDEWEPKLIHCKYYTGEPLGENFHQRGRDDELPAMQDCWCSAGYASQDCDVNAFCDVILCHIVSHRVFFAEKDTESVVV